MKLKQRLDEETSFMLLEPDERDTSTQALARHLDEVSRSENSVVIVADQHGDLAGYVELVGGRFRRNRSTTHVIIGVLAEASGKGVGTGLLEEAKALGGRPRPASDRAQRDGPQSPGNRPV